MNWSNNPRRAAFIALGVCISALLVASADLLQAKPKTAEEKENAIPIPPGHDAKGVKIPFYEDGKLQMLFNMDTAFRQDPGHLKMANLKIETYDEAGKLDIRIDMPSSLLDIGASVLSSDKPVSDKPVTIHRTDFEVTGSNMTFNTQTRHGTFIGRVRMLIFNSEDFAQNSQKHDAAASASGGEGQ